MTKNVSEYQAFLRGEKKLPDHLMVKKERSSRMFRSGLEWITRSPFWVPWTMFLIIVIASFGYGISIMQLPLLPSAGLFLLGALGWTLLEYTMHRFLYHTETESNTLTSLQHNMHGIHHQHPKDKYRLAMPPIPGLVLAGILFGLFWLLLNNWTFVFFAGFMTGYLMYLLFHYAQHVYKTPKYGPWRELWRNHAIHHYRNPYVAFGVSTRLWDWMFGTLPKDKGKVV